MKYADDIDAELIVMRSHGRSNGLGLMLGSASQQVVDNAPGPVLVAVCESSSERAVPRLQTLGTRTDTALLPVR